MEVSTNLLEKPSDRSLSEIIFYTLLVFFLITGLALLITGLVLGIRLLILTFA